MAQAPMASEVVPETRDGFEQTTASASLAHLTGEASRFCCVPNQG
jgi:hypothetical protein